MFTQKPKTTITVKSVLILALPVLMVVAGIVSAMSPLSANAATSDTINFQARLLTAAGNVVPDGYYNVEFKIYKADAKDIGETPIQGACTTNPGAATDEDCLWVETRINADKVRVANGYLTVNLGSVTAFSGAMPWDQQLWLTMNIGGTGSPSWDGEMNPRLKLTATPYAMASGKIVSADGTGSATVANGDVGTICIQGSANCGFIQNQDASSQTANFRIGGTGRADTSLLSPALDVATAGALNIGTSTATSIVLGSNTTNTAIALNSGTGTIDIGTGAQARAINIGTGNAPQLLNIGSTNGNSATFIRGGQGGVRIETDGSGAQAAIQSKSNSMGAFRVLNAAEMPVFNVDTVTSNLISNTSFESGVYNNGVAGWAAHGGSVISQDIMAHYDSDNALNITTTGAGQGARYAYDLEASTQYSFSMFVRAASTTFNTLQLGYSANGSSDTSCVTGQTAKSNTWLRISCTFTTGAVSGSRYVYVKQTDVTARTYYIDAVQLEKAAEPSVYRNGNVTINSTLMINGGALDAASSNAALAVRALYDGKGLVVYGNGDNDIFKPTFEVMAHDSSFSLLNVNEAARATYIRGGSSFLDTAALEVESTDAGAVSLKIKGAASGTKALAVIQGGTTPGSGADLLQLQDAAGTNLFKVDNDGDATLARSLRIDYTAGVTDQLNIQGPSGPFVTVNAANNKFYVGDVANCGGRFCVAQSSSGTGGASYVNTYNSSVFNYSTASTIINQDIYIADTSSSVSNLVRGIRIDSSASTNASATINSFQIIIPSTSSASSFAGNAIQVQNGSTNTFRITNTGQATFQSLNNTNTAFRILNSTGISMFTVNTNGTDNGIYIAGTGTDGVGSRMFFGPTGDNNVWVGEDGSTNSNVLALSGTAGLNIIANGTSVATVSASGAVSFQNATDSHFAFTIKAQANTGIMRVDSIARKIAIGNYSGTGADNIGAQLEILPIHDDRAGLSIRGYSPTYVARYIDIKNSDGADVFNVTANGDIVTASGVFGTSLQSAAGINSNSMSVISGNVTGAGANSGILTLRSGTSATGTTGSVVLMSGNAAGGNSGGITVDSGSATGTAGGIFIGTNNAASLTFGNAAKTQSIRIGSTDTTAGNSTVRIANSTSASNTQTVLIGSNANAASSLTLEAGNTGAMNIGAGATAHTINIGTGAAAQTISIGSTSGASEVDIYSGSGGTTFKSANGTAAFRVLNASDVPLFTVDSTNSRVYVGNPTADAVGALLVLDVKNTSGDPTGVAGAMYYNSSTDSFRCYGTSWKNCSGDRQLAKKSTATQSSFVATLANIDGLSFALEASTDYNLSCNISFYTSTSANTGLNLGFSGPSGASIFAAASIPSTGTNVTTQARVNTFGTAFGASTASANNQTHIATVNAIVRNDVTAGTLAVQFARGGGSGTIIVAPGSSCELQKLP